MFDFINFFRDIAERNRLARKKGFGFCTCSGIAHLEGLLDELRTRKAFFCVSDTCEEATAQRGGAWFKRRLVTVFLLHRYDTRSRASYTAALDTCRELFRQVHSYLLRDSVLQQAEITYLGVGEIKSQELGGQFLNGCTGLLFMLPVDEPINLCFEPSEWEGE